MRQSNFPDRKRLKQKEAQSRQAAWSLLSPEEKLRSLDSRPGNSKKERNRIIKHIAFLKEEKEKK